jgi:hypothetical protein
MGNLYVVELFYWRFYYCVNENSFRWESRERRGSGLMGD